MEKRSKLEYEATAMLLDMVYDETIHAFCIIPEDPQFPCQYWDADTFEELGMDKVTSRGNEAFEKGVLSPWRKVRVD